MAGMMRRTRSRVGLIQFSKIRYVCHGSYSTKAAGHQDHIPKCAIDSSLYIIVFVFQYLKYAVILQNAGSVTVVKTFCLIILARTFV